MDTKEDIQKQLFSVPAIATYIGTGFGAWGVFKNNLILATISLGILCILLLGYLYVINSKYKKHKRYKEINSELHRLAHRTRDFITLLRCHESESDVLHLVDAALRNALTVASNSFSKLTASNCSASLMLRNNGQNIKTVLYCHNADPQRDSQPSGSLSIDEGVAGKAMSTGNVVVWDKGDSTFKPTRKDYEKYYTSGISIPFKSGFDYMGLINIDTLDRNVFDEKLHQEVGATIADTVGLILGAQDLWKELNEK